MMGIKNFIIIIIIIIIIALNFVSLVKANNVSTSTHCITRVISPVQTINVKLRIFEEDGVSVQCIVMQRTRIVIYNHLGRYQIHRKLQI
jgi:cell shape-determining protein MreC